MNEWCEHIQWVLCGLKERWCYEEKRLHVPADTWNFCPICGAPRPKKKELREVLAEKMISMFSNEDTKFWSDYYWKKIADLAIQTIREYDAEAK